MSEPRRAQGVLLVLLASALWGLAPVAGQRALGGGISPELLGVTRLATAALLFAWVGGRGTAWLPRDGWTAVAGLALGLDFVLYNYGLRWTSAAAAGLVVNVSVASTTLLAMWLLGERPSRRRLVGGTITLAGVLFVASENVQAGDLLGSTTFLGNLLVIAGTVCWSLYAVAQRRAPRA